MRCTVLLFAQLADAVGRETLELDLPPGATVGDAIDALGREHDAVAAMQDKVATAVDEAYQPRDATLNDGCTLALIPPVSGG